LDLRLALAREVHRTRGIDHEVGAQVGIGLEFLDVKAVRAGEGLPVEAAGVIAGTYFRYSANSTDDPRCGERCLPATLPIIGTRDSMGSEPRRERRSLSRKEFTPPASL
jgi:hypothetical protein